MSEATRENIPETVLYYLIPVGVGTPYVESLTSYITRLAAAHCVSTGTLISKVIIPQLNKPYLTKIAEHGGTRIYQRSHAMNGVGVMAQTWITALQSLTGRSDLVRLSLIPWHQLIPSRDLLKSTRHWCPLCFDEQAQNSQTVYEPLLWSIKFIKHCGFHNTPLINMCPSCNRQMAQLERTAVPGYCSKCGQWLGTSGNRPAPCHVEQYYCFQVGSLLASDSGNWTIDNLKLVLHDYVYTCHLGNVAAAARNLKMPKTTLWGWVKGVNLPTLHEAVNFCRVIDINLPELFSGILSPSIYNSKLIDSPGPRYIKQAKRRILNYGDIQRKLELALHPQSEPQSLSELSRTIGVDRRLLRRHFPEICDAISVRMHASVSHSSRARVDSLSKDIDNASRYLHASGIYPSRRKIEAYLHRPGLLREAVFKQTWHQSLRCLGYTSLLSTTIDNITE